MKRIVAVALLCFSFEAFAKGGGGHGGGHSSGHGGEGHTSAHESVTEDSTTTPRVYTGHGVSQPVSDASEVSESSPMDDEFWYAILLGLIIIVISTVFGVFLGKRINQQRS